MFSPISCGDGESVADDRREKNGAKARNYSFQTTLSALACRHASRSMARRSHFGVFVRRYDVFISFILQLPEESEQDYNEMESLGKRHEDGCTSTKKP